MEAIMSGNSEELARKLRKRRAVKGLSLRAVAEPAEISPTYLQKLERGQVQDPSPNILYRLSDELDLDYGELMGLAGYLLPADAGETPRIGTVELTHALSSEPLTADEEEALTSYLGFLRSQRGPTGNDA
ncbi:MAG: helix-turn-helix transcriptional regulator [Solirubrobacterales bacterium]